MVEIEGYEEYREFLEALIRWGDTAMQETSGKWSVQNAFLQVEERAKKGVENGVFSPFLYISLSAGLAQEENLFLAAVLYSEISAKRFTFSFWKKFWESRDKDLGKRLFYHAHQVLFEYEERGEGEICVRIVPQIFLFLRDGVLMERAVPGMYWYYRYGSELSFLGISARKYDQMGQCMRQIQGRKLLYLHGVRGSGRKLNYAYLAESLGKNLAVVSYEALECAQHWREIQIECILQHGIPVVELPKEEPANLAAVLGWMDREENLFFLGEWEEFPPYRIKGRQYLSFAIDAQVVQSDREWAGRLVRAYPWEQEEDRMNFLGRYAFLPGKMEHVLELAKTYALCEGKSEISAQNIKQAVLNSGGHSLQKYAKKVEGIYTMEELILPLQQKEKLFHIVKRVKNKKRVYEDWGFAKKSAYGNGVSMIFAGPPGTGKTMAAQVMAAELGMELYRVELPAVVDKYIGETEKKLNRIFEEAEKSAAILFFDEADVLFSKRTEIKESNDKYNNMEIAFLLQKMEEFDGVSILATNYLQNFDEAFRRRIHDIVDFPMPDECSREKMWRSMIPDRLPMADDIDFVFLARQFAVTGSVIKSALLYASFLAAEALEQVLTMRMLLQGIAHELEKSGKKLRIEDFGEYRDFVEKDEF